MKKAADWIFIVLTVGLVFVLSQNSEVRQVFTGKHGSSMPQDEAEDFKGFESVAEKELPDKTHDEWIQKRVDFWIKIYSYYDLDEGLVHDAYSVNKVFERISLKGLTPKEENARIQSAIKKWEQVLVSVDGKKDQMHLMSDEEKRIFLMYADSDYRLRFREVIKLNRVRFQRGQKSRFKAAIVKSGRYLPQFEKIFQKHGLPAELTRLPFVESGFVNHARSSVGAAGVWQFMRATGQRFMIVNDFIDERRDPFRSAQAAAIYLRSNYEKLGTWPLAVTAYNHGGDGLLRAIKEIGTRDFKTLLDLYRGPGFGFASRNFYFEFLAAVHVEKEFQRYFGDLHRDPALEYTEIELPGSIPARVLAQATDLPLDLLIELNPAVDPKIWMTQRPIPADYLLRLPPRYGRKIANIEKKE